MIDDLLELAAEHQLGLYALAGLVVVLIALHYLSGGTRGDSYSIKR